MRQSHIKFTHVQQYTSIHISHIVMHAQAHTRSMLIKFLPLLKQCCCAMWYVHCAYSNVKIFYVDYETRFSFSFIRIFSSILYTGLYKSVQNPSEKCTERQTLRNLLKNSERWVRICLNNKVLFLFYFFRFQS